MKPEHLDLFSNNSRIVMDLCVLADHWGDGKVDRRSLAPKLPIATECKFVSGESERKFYVQPMQLEGRRMLMSDSLKLHYEIWKLTKPMKINECVAGLLCAVQHDSAWVRGRVTAVKDKKKTATVFLFDIGEEEVFKVSHIFYLEEKFVQIAPMALACQMWLDDCEVEFENLKFIMESASFLVKVFALNIPLCVDLKDLNGRCLTQYTVVREADGRKWLKPPGGVYIKASVRTQMQVVRKYKVRYAAPDCDVVEDEVVLSQIGMKTVYVHTKMSLANLEQLRIDLGEFYGKPQTHPNVDIDVDTVCVVWSPQFDCFVRAKITDVDEAIELTAIDYGVQIQPIKRSEAHMLKPLYDGFVSQPHAFCVRLGLLTPKKNQEAEAERMLAAVFEVGTCYRMLLVESMTGTPPPKVDLFELSDEQCECSLTNRCNQAFIEAELARDPKLGRSPVYKQDFGSIPRKEKVLPPDYDSEIDSKYSSTYGAWPPQGKSTKQPFSSTVQHSAADAERGCNTAYPAPKIGSGRGFSTGGVGPRPSRGGFRLQPNGSNKQSNGLGFEFFGFKSSDAVQKGKFAYKLGSDESAIGAQRKVSRQPFGAIRWKSQEFVFGRTEEAPIKPIPKMRLSEDLRHNSKCVVLTSAQAVNKIYVRSLDAVKAANEFEHKLEQHYKALNLKQDPLHPSKLRVGAYYVAQSCTLSRDYGEQTWRRCQIRHVQAHSAQVEFIDFGYGEDISNSELYPLEEEFRSEQCFCCGPFVLYGSEGKQIAPRFEQKLAGHLSPFDEVKTLHFEKREIHTITLTKQTEKGLVNLNQTFFNEN